MKRSIFPLLLWKSLAQRRGRSAITLAALLLGACLVSALLNVSMDIGRKAGRQLEAYGANMLLLPKGGLQVSQVNSASYLPEGDVAVLESREAGAIYFAPYLYAIVEAHGQKIVLGGTRLEASSPLASWWKVDGAWPDAGDSSSALIGIAASRALGVKPGDSLDVQHGGSSLHLRISGTIETGGSEDSQVLASLSVVQRLLGRTGEIGLVQMRAPTGASLEALAGRMERDIPGSEVRIVGQVAQAEGQVLGKVEMLLAIVAALVLLASSLSVSSTLAAAVLERTREIGLMKALGARDRSVVTLLLSEVLILGLVGGLLGYGFGFGLSQVIGFSVFASAVALQPAALGLTVALALAVALVCCIVPVRRILAVDPAITLKGD